MICKRCKKPVLMQYANGMGSCCFKKTTDGRRMARAEEGYKNRMVKRTELQNRAVR